MSPRDLTTGLAAVGSDLGGRNPEIAVAHHVHCAVRELGRESLPLLSVLLDILPDDEVLLRRPLGLADRRVEVKQPAVAALLACTAPATGSSAPPTRAPS